MEAWTPSMTWGPPGKAVYTPLDLFDLLGPCPRQCIHISGTAKTPAGPKTDLRNIYEPSCVSLFLNFNEVLHAVCNRLPPPDFFDHADLEYVLFLYNAHPTNPSRAPAFNYVVPTLFLRQMLTDHLRSVRAAGLWTPPRIAAAVLHRAPSLAAAFYQPLLVEHLLQTRAGRFCYILEPDSDGATASTMRLGPGLALSHRAIDLIPGASDAAFEIEDECSLVPCTGFTAFDAVVVSEGRNRVTLLRSAICAPSLRLDIDTDAIRAAIDVFDRDFPRPEAVKWSFVYAALDGDRAQNLAERDVAQQAFAGVDPRLRVGWMKIATLDRSTRALLVSPIQHYCIAEGPDDAHGLNRKRSRREGQKRRLAKRSLVQSGLQRDSGTIQRFAKRGRSQGRSGREQIRTRTAGSKLMVGWRGRKRVPRHARCSPTYPHQGAYSSQNVRENMRCILPNTEQTVHRTAKLLVRGSVGEGRGREADATVRDVKHVVEPLEERHAVDEVEPFAADAPDVVHDQEHRVCVPADRRVQLHFPFHISHFTVGAQIRSVHGV